jgi:hypothetical protein
VPIVTAGLPPGAIARLALEYPGAAQMLRSAAPLRLRGGEESAAYQLGEFVIRVGVRWRSAAELEWSGRVASTAAATVRTMQQQVGLRYHHANRSILIEGDPLPVRLRRSRTVKAAK